MSHGEFQSFGEFWPYYLSEHTLPLTRRLHLIGTTLGLIIVGLALFLRRPDMLLVALVAGYALPWISHYFVERNRPATFRHPLWSLRADLKMFFLACVGKLDSEVARCKSQNHTAV